MLNLQEFPGLKVVMPANGQTAIIDNSPNELIEMYCDRAVVDATLKHRLPASYGDPMQKTMKAHGGEEGAAEQTYGSAHPVEYHMNGAVIDKAQDTVQGMVIRADAQAVQVDLDE